MMYLLTDLIILKKKSIVLSIEPDFLGSSIIFYQNKSSLAFAFFTTSEIINLQLT